MRVSPRLAALTPGGCEAHSNSRTSTKGQRGSPCDSAARAQRQIRAHPAEVYGVTVIMSDWSDVPDRLATLSAHPGAESAFGANGHQWRREPSITEIELAELQSQLGVDLPDECRAFLLQVSRGGAGPRIRALSAPPR
jgi:hypothetical protein